MIDYILINEDRPDEWCLTITQLKPRPVFIDMDFILTTDYSMIPNELLNKEYTNIIEGI